MEYKMYYERMILRREIEHQRDGLFHDWDIIKFYDYYVTKILLDDQDVLEDFILERIDQGEE